MKEFKEGKVSAQRIASFLELAEVEKLSTKSRPVASNSIPPDVALVVRDVSACYDGDDGSSFQFKNLNFVLRRGALSIGIGPIGCGKSSLLSLVLGELTITAGTLIRDSGSGKMAVVPQTPWILNETLRENVLFGEPFDESKYYQVLRAACLLDDVALLPAGDATEIGERGINLSGGQKARISLARAAYAAEKDTIVLLDDVLSALDAHVSAHVFEQCISGFLVKELNATVLLMTHQLQFADRSDHLIVLKNGRIMNQGFPDDVTDELAQLRRHTAGGGEDSSTSPTHEVPATTLAPPVVPKDQVVKTATIKPSLAAADEKKGRLTQAEARRTGGLSVGTLSFYIHHAGGWGAFGLVLGLYFLEFGARAAADFVVGKWLENDGSDVPPFPWQYVLLTGTMVLGGILQAIAFAYSVVTASSGVHRHMLTRLMELPMTFFHITPVGQVLNRFSNDQSVTDDMLPNAIAPFMKVLFIAIASFVSIIVVFPGFAFGLPLLFWVFKTLTTMFKRSVIELKRIDNNTRSPIFSTLSASLNGLSSIRGYGAEDRISSLFQAHLETNHRAHFLFIIAGRWLGCRLDIISATVVLLVALLSLIFEVPPSYASLSLIYAITSTGIFQWGFRMYVDATNYMTSVERSRDFTMLTGEASPSTAVRTSWPESGAIHFAGVCMRYRAELEPALSGLSFDVRAGSSVGLVGRTGSGKSSMSVAMFRLVGNDLLSGRITIDGVDTAAVPLATLRSRMSMIPQDPVIFTGTLRYNVDPISAHTDDEVTSALRAVQLDQLLATAQDKRNNVSGGPSASLSHDALLNFAIAELGGNLSSGEAQLACFARALLKRNRVVMLDEATANCDQQTDTTIQKLIRSAFAECTVLTIAHRLVTIIDYDTVMLMHEGAVAEMGAPATLLADPQSRFLSLVGEVGEAGAAQLHAIAAATAATIQQ